ncbi:MAG: MarR family transcriptional regulator [Bacilli bacterium]|nr:MarR family transcriptional regulator [Bacilli bacterium]
MNKLDEKQKQCILDENKTLMMLVRDVHHLFGHKIHESMVNKGVSNTVHAILIHLDHHEYLTQVELVERAHVRPSTVSVALQKMEADGLITRTTSAEDQRCIKVKITEAGKKICEEGRKQVQMLDVNLTSEIDEEELKITKEVLRKLVKKMLEDCKK